MVPKNSDLLKRLFQGRWRGSIAMMGQTYVPLLLKTRGAPTTTNWLSIRAGNHFVCALIPAVEPTIKVLTHFTFYFSRPESYPFIFMLPSSTLHSSSVYPLLRRLAGCACLTFMACILRAQTKDGALLRYLPPAHVTCTPMGSFVCTVFVYNPTNDTVYFTQQPFTSDYFVQLGQAGSRRGIAPGDTIQLRFRFVNKYGRINGLYQLPMMLQPESGPLLSISLPVQLVQGMEQRVFAEALSDKLWIMPGMQQVMIPVRMRSYMPAGTLVLFELAEPHPSLMMAQSQVMMQLPQLRDTIIQLPMVRLTPKKGMQLSDRQLAIRVVGADGRILTSFSLLPYVLTASRTLISPDAPAAGLQIRTGVGLQSGGGQQEELSLSFQPAQPIGSLAGQLNYIRFGATGQHQLNGTWLQYRTQHQTLQAGNIADFHELNLLGRGMRLSHQMPIQKIQADVWLIDNNLNLLAPFSGPTDHTLSTQLTLGAIKSGELLLNTNWFRRSNSFSSGNLQFVEWHTTSGEKGLLSARIGTSHEHFSRLDTALRGVSALLEGAFSVMKINIRGRFYYASPTYAGNQRGLLNGSLNAAITQSKSYSLNLRYSLFANQVSPVLWRIFPQQPMQMQTLETDAGFRFGQTTLNIKPYYLQQHQQFPLLMGGGELRSRALNTSILMSHRIGNLGLGFNWDGGLQQKMPAGKPVTTSLAWRSSVNLSWRKFTVSGFMQQGGYFLAEQQSALTTGDPFRNITTSAGYGSPLGKHWSVMTTVSSTYNSIFGIWQHNAFQELRWSKDAWQAGATLMYFGGRQGLLQTRVGVQKNFSFQPHKRHLLQVAVKVFEDHNGNGLHDENELLADGNLVRINGMIMITDASGMIRLNGLRPGTHLFEVLSKGISNTLLMAKRVELKSKATLMLGIPPLYEITGTVITREDRFTGKAEATGNIRVTLSGSDGEHIAFTNNKGVFRFQAPAGNYQVFITQLQGRQIPGTSAPITVHPQQGFTGKLELVWTAGERPVQVKKVKIQ